MPTTATTTALATANPTAAATAIRVENVSKTYGRGPRAVTALAGVTLSVRPGEIYGLLGRNGAGKTTLVKVLLDLVRPSRGHAFLLERNAREPGARHPAGYLPEDHRFPDYQTALGAITFYAALSGVDRRTARRRAGELLERVKLGHAAGKKVRTFSKGMKQRLGLAQALVHQPRVLLLDEPTDGVDPVGRAEIRDLLVELKAQGVTIFLNSHLLSEVEQVCDRVGILERGALVREGTVEELTRTERVYQVATDRAPDAATVAEVQRLAVSFRASANGAFEVALQRDEDVDRIVDLLRAKGFGLRHLHGKRLSLEEVFLDAVEGTREAGR